ncbi:MAG: hypothetical protein GF411_00035 [Candidatus Lokiarchaeota archaeon]|nr:hypothetical protein [Candidatus Lokiarchaeota archaeon]
MKSIKKECIVCGSKEPQDTVWISAPNRLFHYCSSSCKKIVANIHKITDLQNTLFPDDDSIYLAIEYCFNIWKESPNQDETIKYQTLQSILEDFDTLRKVSKKLREHTMKYT